MKRLLVDAIFIFILVALGTSLKDTSTTEIKEDLSNKVQTFEEDIAMHRTLKTPDDTIKLNNIEENKASSFARDTSNVIIDIMDTSLSVVSEVFHGILE